MSQAGPDKHGHFGIYGGRYIPDTLFAAVRELEKAYLAVKKDKSFRWSVFLFLAFISAFIGRLLRTSTLIRNSGA